MHPRRQTNCSGAGGSVIKLTLPAASAAELVPNVMGFLSFGAYQQCREGDPDAWATQVLHIICPGLHPGEATPVSPHGVDTREAAVTGYKPYC